VVILARLVDDLLDVTRMTTGKVVITPAAVDVGEIVRQCVTTLTDAGRLAGHRVSVHATSVGACADAARLEQIVLNLITNAVKFTPPGGRIEVAVTDEDGDAVVRVADEGIGMPADLLPRVFDLFVQGRRGLDRAGGGLGLGLTLVRRLVELHGGRVEAHSEGPGRGSVFTVRLPALAAAPAGPAAAPTASAAPTPSRRVLVAEDNDDSREMLQVWLQGLEHEVHVAADGVAAVDLALRVRPDIAFIDIGLPGLDGYEVARRIRAEERSEAMRLIALTGYGQPEDRRRALDAGFDDHVVKPMDLDALVRALNG
jgi:CheY-like chemotaxis protein/anti-sigma regulatory factor (Ser/Thr protein kinase)